MSESTRPRWAEAVSPASSSKSALSWLWLALLVIVLDLGTKAIALAMLHFNTPVPVIPGLFDLTLLYNFGAAFSFLAEHAGWQRWLFAGIAVIVVVALSLWLRRIARQHWQLAAPVALVIGGALGNLFDRIVHGYVIDFLSFHWFDSYYYPAFNLADTAIVIGTAGLVWDAFRRDKRASASH